MELVFEQGLAFALKSVGKGHLTLKKEQLSALRHAYDGDDVFVLLPTEFGKSIVYECLFARPQTRSSTCL